jgi:signal transduction histidine kinase/DNA-binding response OmpR family regulator
MSHLPGFLKGFLFSLLSTIGFCGAGMPFLGAQSYTIDTFQEVYYLNDSLELLVDSSHSLSFEQVRSTAYSRNFQAFHKLVESPNRELSPDPAYWGRITLLDSLPDYPFRDWRLYLARADSIEVYVPNGQNTQYKVLLAGDLYAAHHKALPYAHHLRRVPLSLENGLPTTIYFRLRSVRNYKIALNLRFQQEEVYADWGSNIFKRREGLFLGFILTMMLFSFVMASATKDRAFFFHGIFLIGVTGFMLDIHRILHNAPLISDYPIIKNYVVYFFITLMDIGYLQFIRQYTNLSRNFPKWDKVFQWLILYRLVAFLLSITFYFFIQDEPLSDTVLAVSFFAEYFFVILPFLFVLYGARVRMYNYVIIGTALILLDIVLNGVAVFANSSPPMILTHIGIIGEIMFFSYGLGYRFLALRRQREEALKLQEINAVKSRFYTNITHEFRTPIAVIQGMTERIKGLEQSSVNGKEMKDSLSYIDRNSNRLLNLVDQLLELSRIESGMIQYTPKRGNIAAFLRYITESLQPLTASKDISLSYFGAEEEFEMDFDEEKLRQILSNLISNAYKYSPPGAKISVKGEVLQVRGREHFQITVKDTGKGIPKKDLPHIFDRFYQVEENKGQMQAGTGVGLALVKELVKLMKGEIDVESTVGQGTTFRLDIPVKRQATEQFGTFQGVKTEEFVSEVLEETETLTAASADGTDPFTVLIVEDNPGMVEILKTHLAGKYKLEVAFNGKRGIEKALEVVPDLIITDLMMPEVDGFELVQRLHSERATSHIPIIVLTAKVGDEDRIRALSAGAIDYLTKPFHAPELLLKIDNVLQLQQQMIQRLRGDDPVGVEKGKPLSLDEEFMRDVQTAIDDNYTEENFGVDQLASKVYLSRSQLHRKVKKLFGNSASKLILEKRMKEACRLLRESDLPIGDVAFEVGFSDHSYFTKVFFNHQKTLPSEYREKVG